MNRTKLLPGLGLACGYLLRLPVAYEPKSRRIYFWSVGLAYTNTTLSVDEIKNADEDYGQLWMSLTRLFGPACISDAISAEQRVLMRNAQIQLTQELRHKVLKTFGTFPVACTVTINLEIQRIPSHQHWIFK